MKKAIIIGGIGTLVLLGIYFSVLTLISGWRYTTQQFAQYWYYLVILALGFGIQLGLYMYQRQIVAQQYASGKALAVSGTTSTVAMLSCCSHYVANLIPILGVAGAITLITQYQIELFWVGLLANLLGIIYMIKKIREIKIVL